MTHPFQNHERPSNRIFVPDSPKEGIATNGRRSLNRANIRLVVSPEVVAQFNRQKVTRIKGDYSPTAELATNDQGEQTLSLYWAVDAALGTVAHHYADVPEFTKAQFGLRRAIDDLALTVHDHIREPAKVSSSDVQEKRAALTERLARGVTTQECAEEATTKITAVLKETYAMRNKSRGR